MAKRRFQLPREEELSKEQDSVLALPEDGQYLIIGGPGTGKSVVALLRAMKYYRPNNSRFLTYNKVLRAATEQLVNFPKPDDAMTINSWFFRSYQRIFGRNQRLPEKQRFVYDYEKVVDQANRIPEQRKQKWSFFHLIIDEGQDMPIGFYRSLMELGLENFFIVADQNQQITELNSSRQELTAVLALQASEVLELTQNYRNSRPIAAFAGYFHTDKASPPPMLPDRPSLDTPLLFEYTREQDCISLILRESDKDAGRLIGVIVANNEIRKRYVKVLQSLDI
ncbi:MAG: AAA family ATPase, partial [Thiothrix sp.]|nr:AAA family ATPase [Thiothrix sp.]